MIKMILRGILALITLPIWWIIGSAAIAILGLIPMLAIVRLVECGIGMLGEDTDYWKGEAKEAGWILGVVIGGPPYTAYRYVRYGEMPEL